MRGYRSIYDIDISKEAVTNVKKNGGRDKVLIEKRNEALMYRYYFYKTFTKYRYDHILSLLKDDFYLSTLQIIKIITNTFELYKKIKQNRPAINHFKEKFPNLNWSLKDI